MGIANLRIIISKKKEIKRANDIIFLSVVCGEEMACFCLIHCNLTNFGK